MSDSSAKSYIQEFGKCPVCSAKWFGLWWWWRKLLKTLRLTARGPGQRFFETITNELKAEGRVPQDWNMYWDLRTDAIFPPKKLPLLPMGSVVPAFRAVSDICQECGSIWAVRLQRTVAKIGPSMQAPGGKLPTIDEVLGQSVRKKPEAS